MVTLQLRLSSPEVRASARLQHHGFWPAKNLPNPVLLSRSRFSIRPVSPATAISKTSFARSTLRVTQRSTLVVDIVDVLLERGPVDPMPPDRTIPPKTVRLIILADAGMNGAGLLVITQTINGTTKTYEVSLAPGKTIQFDVE